MEDHVWEHRNAWGWPYSMRCARVESEHLWLECNGEWHRVVKGEFAFLQCEGFDGWRNVADSRFHGFPCMIAGDASRLRNVLVEPEKVFETKEEMLLDLESFRAKPDPDYKEICNDIFGI